MYELMKTYMAFGDSILKGIINNDGHFSICRESAVRLCEKRQDIRIDNKARMGSTITDGIRIFKRYTDAVREADGKWVLLKFGGNDSDHDWAAVSARPGEDIPPKTEPERFIELYVSLIDEVRKLGKEPLILSMPPMDSDRYFEWISRTFDRDRVLAFLDGNIRRLGEWHDEYNLYVSDIAARCGAELVDISTPFLNLKDYRSLLCCDGIHPNPEGQALIAETLISLNLL